MLLLSPFEDYPWTTNRMRNRNINTISIKLYVTLNHNKWQRLPDAVNVTVRDHVSIMVRDTPRETDVCSCTSDKATQWYSPKQVIFPEGHPNRTLFATMANVCKDFTWTQKKPGRRRNHSNSLLSLEWSVGEAGSIRWTLHGKQSYRVWFLLPGEKKKKEITETIWITGNFE